MTNRLYYDNPYVTQFDATVLACRPCGDSWEVLLDRSAFYPTSGGQPFDTGTLGGARVTDVNVTDGEVWHTVDSPLSVDAQVKGCIDWPRRFDHMQQHAADHMIASALHRLMGGVTIGLHISADVSTIDVAMPGGATHLTDEDIRRIEDDVNERIQRDVPIRCWFPEAAELAALPLRKAPTVTEHVRIVAIGEDEMVACGGTHPATAGQIGLVKILSATPARGKMRVAFLAGQRALADYRQARQSAQEAAKLLSSPVEKLPDSLRALQEKLLAAQDEIAGLRRAQLFARTDELLMEAQPLPDGSFLVARMVEANASTLHEFASHLITTPGYVVLLGAKRGDTVQYVFGRADDVDVNMGALMRQAAALCGGKGGGRPDFAQGGGSEEMLMEAVRLVRQGLC